MTPDEPKRENPSELQLEGVSEGIGALPKESIGMERQKTGLSMSSIIWKRCQSIKPLQDG